MSVTPCCTLMSKWATLACQCYPRTTTAHPTKYFLPLESHRKKGNTMHTMRAVWPKDCLGRSRTTDRSSRRRGDSASAGRHKIFLVAGCAETRMGPFPINGSSPPGKLSKSCKKRKRMRGLRACHFSSQNITIGHACFWGFAALLFLSLGVPFLLSGLSCLKRSKFA